MKALIINEDEKEQIIQHNEICIASVRAIFKRSGYNFDDIENLTDTHELYDWGSNKDRQYRASLIKKAINMVATNPLTYITI